jgi:hypothetical protein
MSVNAIYGALTLGNCEALFNIDLGWALRQKDTNFARVCFYGDGTRETLSLLTRWETTSQRLKFSVGVTEMASTFIS